MPNNLIIVDSDSYLVEDLKRRFLLEPYYKVIDTSGVGIEGINKIQNQKPDYVIVSYPLVDMDIIAFIKNINMVCPTCKIIATLSVDNPLLVSQTIESGANYVLTKPYSFDKLIESMKMIEQRQQTLNNTVNSNTGSNPKVEEKVTTKEFEVYPNVGANTQGTSTTPKEDVPYYGTPPQYSAPYGTQGQPQNTNLNQESTQSPNTVPNPNLNMNANQNQNTGFGNNQFPEPNREFQNNYNQGSNYGGGQNNPNGINGVNNGGYITLDQPQNGMKPFKQTIIAVGGPKGGVGKSTIAKELATKLAITRCMGQLLKVVIVDCDMDFGDTASLFKLNPYPNISQWASDIKQRLTVNPHIKPKYAQNFIENNYLITHESGLKVLPAPSNHLDSMVFDENSKILMEIIIENLKNCDFDIIILDTGNNTKDITLVPFEFANRVFITTTLDLTAINDTNSLLDALRKIQFTMSKVELIVNKIPKLNADKDIDIHEIIQVLNIHPVGFLPEFPKMRQVNNSGKPLALGKDCEYTLAINNIIKTIVPTENDARAKGQRINNSNGRPNNNVRGTSNQGGIQGFFKKIFGKN